MVTVTNSFCSYISLLAILNKNVILSKKLEQFSIGYVTILLIILICFASIEKTL